MRQRVCARSSHARTLKRMPEVMVKIPNKASSAQGMGAVRRQLRYISRSGNVGVGVEDGQTVVGADELLDLTDALRLGGRGIPEKSVRRKVFNILLPMLPGTDRRAVRDAARDSRPWDLAMAVHTCCLR